MSSERPDLPSAVGEIARERVIRELGDHFAHDHLTLEQYEQRLDRAMRAVQRVELEALTRDLPTLFTHAELAMHDTAGRSTLATGGAPFSRTKWLLAFMSGAVRRGRWTVTPHIRAIAVMGGVMIDLREADFTAPVTEIFAVAVMGGVSVCVPPHVRLESDGIAIMGGFEDHLHQSAAGPGAPVVRVRGFALMGGVKARVLQPGAPVPDD